MIFLFAAPLIFQLAAPFIFRKIPFGYIIMLSSSLIIATTLLNFHLMGKAMSAHNIRCGMPLVGMFVIEVLVLCVLVIMVVIQILIRRKLKKQMK